MWLFWYKCAYPWDNHVALASHTVHLGRSLFEELASIILSLSVWKQIHRNKLFSLKGQESILAMT